MGSPDAITAHKPVLILFDGVCNLCNGAVQFIIKRDSKAKFRFASLQSEFGKSQLVKFNLDPDSLHTIVLIEEDQVFERSDAVLRIAKRLDGAWKFFSVLKIIPKFLRDACYTLISSSRYRIFGKQDSCMIPSPELKYRFIE
jgi:predicted DCC family thiol-disulfide oxidoreductase YuxK